jgi:hypothetical protein
MPIRKESYKTGTVTNPLGTGSDNEIARFDNAYNKIQGSGISINDAGMLDRASAAALNIGTSGASATSIAVGNSSIVTTIDGSTINIGSGSSTVNIIGSVKSIQATNTYVTDKLITLNDGGGAATGNGTGIEVEEDNLITGYAKVSADRNSWEIKAPNTAGVVTITPGASGFTISGAPVYSSSGSSTDNTIVRFDGTGGNTIQTTSIVIDDTDNMSGLTSLSTGDLTATGTTTLAVALTGVVKAVSGVISAATLVNADVDASAAIAYGKLALSNSIVNADINTSAAIAYSKLNLTGSIVDADVNASAAIAVNKLAAVTASRALVSDGSGFVSAATTTATEIGYVNGVTSAIQTQINSKIGITDIFNMSTGSGAFSASADTTYVVDTSGGVATVTLPAPTADRFVRIKDNGNAVANNITVNPNAAETLDGASSYVISSDYGAATFVADGTNWYIL